MNYTEKKVKNPKINNKLQHSLCFSLGILLLIAFWIYNPICAQAAEQPLWEDGRPQFIISMQYSSLLSNRCWYMADNGQMRALRKEAPNDIDIADNSWKTCDIDGHISEKDLAENYSKVPAIGKITSSEMVIYSKLVRRIEGQHNIERKQRRLYDAGCYDVACYIWNEARQSYKKIELYHCDESDEIKNKAPEALQLIELLDKQAKKIMSYFPY